MSGLMIAAPSSGSGKTTITLGLLRAFAKRGIAVQPGKAGPDYIDPAFHAMACGAPCLNFDPWAMRPELLAAQAHGGNVLIEAMMGLYDASADGTGSPADLAQGLDLAVVLVVDCARMSHSVGALVRGYASHRPGLRLAGVILNKVGSNRHEAMLRDGLAGLDIAVLGAMKTDPALGLPERHLGLVQAGEHSGIEAFMDHAAECVASGCDLQAIAALMARPNDTARADVRPLPPLGNHIAIAHDDAFSFLYQHLLDGWSRDGATMSFFSPLGDEAPDNAADAVYLPGGYPELHAGKLSAAGRFIAAMKQAAESGTFIYGECGGYMCLGKALVDATGERHPMLGLLPLVTSFQKRQRHLGYRRLRPLHERFSGLAFTAHEFHYSTIVEEGPGESLFMAEDALGTDLGAVGLQDGSVCGSYMHLIDVRA